MNYTQFYHMNRSIKDNDFMGKCDLVNSKIANERQAYLTNPSKLKNWIGFKRL